MKLFFRFDKTLLLVPAASLLYTLQYAPAALCKGKPVQLELLNANISRNKKVDKYLAAVAKTFESNWRCTASTDEKPILFFKIDPFGRIKDLTLLEKSKDQSINKAAERAINSSTPLENPPMRVSLKVRATFDCTQLKKSDPLPEPPATDGSDTVNSDSTRYSVAPPSLIDVSRDESSAGSVSRPKP